MNKAVTGISFGCVLAAGVGYWLALQAFSSTENGFEVSGKAQSMEKRRDHQEMRPLNAAAKIRNAAQLADLKGDLRERFRKSPDAAHDWPLREQALAILAAMSPQELAEFTEEGLPQGSLPNRRSLRNIDNPLFHETLRGWGLKDPETACLTLAEKHLGALSEVFGQWQQRDPVAAKRWLEDAHLPVDESDVKNLLERNFMTQQVTDDFTAARGSLEKLDPADQQQVLRDWSVQLAHDPDKRAELLLLLATRGDAGLTDKCYQALIGEMADKSPAEAANFIETTKLSEEQKNKLNDQVMNDWTMKAPAQAFAKWTELGREGLPPKMSQAISSWGIDLRGRNQIVEWIKTLPSGPARDQFSLQVIGRNSEEQDAELTASLTDSEQRIDKMLAAKRRWEASSPDSAKAWFDKLPQADKDAMERKE